MKKLHFALTVALFASLILLSALSVTPALAQCPEDDPDCPLDPPQSEQINTDPITGEGSTGEVSDPGALQPLESDLQGDGPLIINPEPFGQSGSTAPWFEKINIPIRWQEPTDVSCGVQALGMAFDGLGGGSPTSNAILEDLQSNNMMYDFGTGVEELAYAAQNFGYKGTIPFHNWSLSDLQEELSEGRTPVVAIGSNGAGQPGHFVTVTGISPDGKWISYNDPTLGEQTITVEEFNRLWGLQGNSGVAVRKTVLSSEADLVPWVAFAATLMAIISQTPLALRRMGIGGRLIAAGGGSTRRRTVRPRRTRPRTVRPKPPRRFRPHSRPTRATPPSTPPRDPSPQMRNDAPPASPQHWKEKLLEQKSHPAPEPVLEPVPKFGSDPLGWFQASLINLGRKDKKVRNVMASTMAPASDFFSSVADKKRNPFAATFRENMIGTYNRAVNGFKTAIDASKALASYSIDAVRDRRWDDVWRAVKGYGQAFVGGIAETVKATVKGTAIVAVGFVTTPIRLVTRTIPNFVRSIKERGEGKDRAWDVILSGAFLEGDLLATYGLAKITGVTDKVNAVAQARLFGPTNSVADTLMPGGNPIGNPGSRPGIRELPGGNAAAQNMFNELSVGGTNVTPANYPGTLIELPGGGYIGFRPTSASGPPTIDVNILEILFKKIKFP